MTRIVLAITMSLLLTGSTLAGEWIKGDLHNHSHYSDGDSPIADVIASAEAVGLDYFVITDHDNYMDGQPIHWFDPDYHSDSMVLLYGVEWSTSMGHANIWANAPFDYDALWQANLDDDPNAVVAAAHEQGALISINHPLRYTWDHPVVGGMDGIEVWNGPMLINQNYRATHEFWDDVLLEGRRVTAVGGSDTHHLHDFLAAFTGHGQPTTWVYVEERSVDAILDAIKQGHVSVSYKADAVRLDLTADVDGDGVYETIVGDNIEGDNGVGTNGLVSFRVRLVGGPEGSGHAVELSQQLVDRLDRKALSFFDMMWLFFTMFQVSFDGNVQLVTVVKGGEPMTGWLISGGTNELTFEDAPGSAGPMFYRAELFGETEMQSFLNRVIYGVRRAITNPIYVNY